MDFNWSDDQLAYRDAVREFATERLGRDHLARDQAGEFSRADWQACAAFGVQSLSVPETYSGRAEKDFLTAMLAMEAMGYACRDNGLTFALNAQIWTVQRPIAEVGTDWQKERYLPGLCNGEFIGAHAMTERETGSDAFSLQTSATKADDGYLLNGTKCYISLGPIADVALVFATVDRELGRWGVTAFLVETSWKGVSAGPVQAKMGLRTVPMSDLCFDNCFVPEQNRLGAEGSGVGLSSSFLEWERCCILASQLGAMERQLEECIRYAREREQFGQPIGKFQSVSNRIVDMKLRLETSRLLLNKAAWMKQCGKSAMAEVALLKLHLSECFVASSLDAVRIHGGKGYLAENLIERDLRDAVGGVLYAGTSDIQRNIIARLLGL